MHLLLLWKNALQRLKRLSGRISFFKVVPKLISFSYISFVSSIHSIQSIINLQMGSLRIR